MKTAFLFPGQGAQQVGMGRDVYSSFAAARTIFDLAETVTGLPLKRLCFEGPQEELSRTDVCQPAIFTVSAALLACLNDRLSPSQAQALRPAYMAGLSLGEYTALYAADMIDFQDALRLVAVRGAAMQRAATAVPSGMLAVVGLDEPRAGALCAQAAQGQVLVPANFNAPGQVVLSGHAEACRRAEGLAKDFGASGATALQVAGAFHSPLMAPAAEQLAKALEGLSFRPPRRRPIGEERAAGAEPSDGQGFAANGAEVVANVDAKPHGFNGAVQSRLLEQLTRPVRWQQSMEFLRSQGVRRFYEIGPGRVLAGLLKRLDRRADIVCVNSNEGLEKLAKG
jgi:[acyl-carrier-protein] S-malonyltransferase